jgi:molecular chaperone GrpE
MEDSDKDVLKEPSLQEFNEGTELVACRTELIEIKNRYLYLNAEFDTFKRRQIKDQASLLEIAQDRVLIDFLALVDDLERAYEELKVQELPPEVASHFQGISMIVKNLASVLKKYEIEEISQRGHFDPHFFEAVMQQDSPNHQSGEIVTVLQKGYTRRGRILRPAKVVVAP